MAPPLLFAAFTLRVAFGLGGAGADDVAVLPVNSAGAALRIVDCRWFIAAPRTGATLQLSAGPAATALLLDAQDASAVGTYDITDLPANTSTAVVPAGAPLFVRRSDGRVAGEVVVTLMLA